MVQRICSIDGCDRSVHGRGLCLKHYRRWRRHGDAATVLISRHEGDPQERFWAKVHKTPDCWIWTAAVSSSGYGNYFVGGKYVAAHRFAYESSGGDVSDGMEVDHRCHNKLCVRPAHLRAVTSSQNNENYQIGPLQTRSGVRGIDWYAPRGMWRARVKKNGKYVYTELFRSLEQAQAAVLEHRNRIHTHNDADRVQTTPVDVTGG